MQCRPPKVLSNYSESYTCHSVIQDEIFKMAANVAIANMKITITSLLIHLGMYFLGVYRPRSIKNSHKTLGGLSSPNGLQMHGQPTSHGLATGLSPNSVE